MAIIYTVPHHLSFISRPQVLSAPSSPKSTQKRSPVGRSDFIRSVGIDQHHAISCYAVVRVFSSNSAPPSVSKARNPKDRFVD
jgi:hypothetical protein